MADIIHKSRRKSRKAKQISSSEAPPEAFATKTSQISESARPKWLYILLIASVAFLVFSPALKNDFTNWDDHPYVLENPMLKNLDKETVKEIFFSENPGRRFWMGNYHPLTMLSLNLTYQLYNKNGEPVAWIFILINILLHTINSVLVYLIILQLFKNQKIAVFTALLFAVHTLHVESVAWIAERKDVLYTFFYLWSLWSYIKYTRREKLHVYFISLLLFVLSLLSKGQAVSLAVTLLLIDFIQQRKLTSTKVIIEKIPFFVLALIFGLIAIIAQKHSSALQEQNDYEFYKRIAVAAYGYIMYLLKLILPINLSALYPYPDIVHKTVPWYFWFMLIPAAGTLIPAYKAYKNNNKILFFSIAFFVINIFLLLQLIQVGGAMYADRYAYIPSIGIFTLFAWLFDKVYQKKKDLALFAGLSYLLVLSFLTVSRIEVWHNSLSLWEDTVKKQPKAVVAWNNLGSEISEIAKKEKDSGNTAAFKSLANRAIDAFTHAIEGKPDYSHAFYNRAVITKDLAEVTNDSVLWNKALEDLNRAIAIDLEFTEAFIQRGVIYEHFGNFAKAEKDFQRVLSLEPDNAKALVNLGTVYGKERKFDKSVETFDKAIAVNPELPEAYANKGLALFYMQKYTEAIDNLNKAIALDSTNNFSAFYNRALAYAALGKYDKAINDLTKAIGSRPKNPDAYYLRGQYFFKIGRIDNACSDFHKAASLGSQPAKQAIKNFCNKT